MTSKKDVQGLIKNLKDQGFTVEKTKSSHWKVFHPKMDGVTFLASTPSDRRSLANNIRDLRKIGYRP